MLLPFNANGINYAKWDERYIVFIRVWWRALKPKTLEAARQSFHTQVEEVKAEPSCDSIVSDVHLRLIADDQTSTMIVHKAVLQRSPYFQARLADHWHNAKEEKTGLLPLRLPPGCPVAAATVVIRYLYTDVEVQILPLKREVFAAERSMLRQELRECFVRERYGRQPSAGPGNAPQIDSEIQQSWMLEQASVAIGAAQLSQMLLLEDLAEESVVVVAVAVVAVAVAIVERFVALPEPLTKVCEAVQLSPAVELRTEELAAAVLAAAGEGGGGQAMELGRLCKQTWSQKKPRPAAKQCLGFNQVISALEAMPFKVPAGSIAANASKALNLEDLTCNAVGGVSDLGNRILTLQSLDFCQLSWPFFALVFHWASASPGEDLNMVTTGVKSSVLAFGAYLQHLAIMQHCDELSQVKSPAAFRTVASIAKALAVVLAGLLELPAEALAELVTDRLLEVAGDASARPTPPLRQPCAVAGNVAARHCPGGMPDGRPSGVAELEIETRFGAGPYNLKIVLVIERQISTLSNIRSGRSTGPLIEGAWQKQSERMGSNVFLPEERVLGCRAPCVWRRHGQGVTVAVAMAWHAAGKAHWHGIA
ncbi:hypothetical protein AK812_SmicGene7211 [Symbiodinium microadriaticum]|uniref:BTB domain-containing protein n=1 Tax=Symbiodinium microadriaticum TaxID=2951 RepID=A0A1Q9EP86_SYMMI|nr:hypothetical protein AK812_SmicGene7211 [Symbiodinium microadriaticum]